MQIRELYLQNFGRFSEKRIPLHDGINVFYGENEAGKSTLHTFIKGMLFGIDKQRGKAARNDVYSTYQPWKYPAYYAGIMKFTCGGKQFRLERSFHKNQKEVQLVCESDGELLSVEQGDLAMLLDGLTESVFQNTVFVGQMKAKTEDGLGAQLKNYAANYYEAGDFELDIEKAVGLLKEEKKAALKRLKGEQDKQRRKRAQVESKIAYIEQEIQDKRAEISQLLDPLREMQSSRVKPQPSADLDGRTAAKPGRAGLGIGFLLVMMAGVLFWFSRIEYRGIYALLLSIAGMLCFLYSFKKKAVRIKPDTPVPAEQENQSYFEKLEWKREHLETECREKQINLENLYEILAELEDAGSGTGKVKRELAALELSIETIQQLSAEVQEAQGDLLSQRASEIFSELTAGKYTSLVIDEMLNIRINTPDKLLSPEQVSKSTVEQIYFSLRMAASQILFPDTGLPVILDDTFVMYDDQRLAETLNWLARNKQQVLLFTCHKREAQLMEAEGIPYNKIEL